MVSGEALKKLQEQIAAWPMAQRFVVQQLILDYLRNREDVRAYEATGLTPEEVSTLVKDWSDLCTIVGECGGITRVKALARADKEGRVVVLPCKVGDTVYSIFGAEVIEKTVGCVIINGYTTPRIWVDLDCSFLSSVTTRWDLGIGKDFFLTREEAKKALEAMKNV
jgi:hypothetical protein